MVASAPTGGAPERCPEGESLAPPGRSRAGPAAPVAVGAAVALAVSLAVSLAGASGLVGSLRAAGSGSTAPPATPVQPPALGSPDGADPTGDSGATAGGAVGGGVARTDVGPAIRPLPPAQGIPVIETAQPRPTAIRIPEIGVERSAVRAVGVESDGDYEVPGVSEVGWYRFGSAPGQTGSTVMAAHVAYDGRDGVFRWLDRIERGAVVTVELDDGSTVSYEVVGKATYVKTELPFDEIFSESGPDRLALITCGGEFDRELRSYESNVVAYAVPVT